MPAATPRCAVSARARDDDVVATAPPARRVLALEVPGPWPAADPLDAAGLGGPVAARLRAAGGEHGLRVLLVRRPGRHPRVPRPRAWLLVDVLAGTSTAGVWSTPDDLAAVDVGAVLAAHSGPPVLLVCTHGRHDVCCAVDGRPVATALAADRRLDVWECSHLGGDRFAANVLALPSGDLAGRLSVADVPAYADAVVDGRVLPDRHRGRCGTPPPVQAAHALALRDVGEDRPDALTVTLSATGTDRWDVVARHRGRTRAYRLVASPGPPARLTCAATGTSRARRWELTPTA